MSVETHLAGRIYPGDRKDLIAYMEKVMMMINMTVMMTVVTLMTITQVGYRHIDWAHQSTNADRSSMGTNDDLFVRNDVPLVKEEGWHAGVDLKKAFGGKVFKKGSLEEKEALEKWRREEELADHMEEKLAEHMEEKLADHMEEELLSDSAQIGNLLQNPDRKEL